MPLFDRTILMCYTVFAASTPTLTGKEVKKVSELIASILSSVAESVIADYITKWLDKKHKKQ